MDERVKKQWRCRKCHPRKRCGALGRARFQYAAHRRQKTRAEHHVALAPALGGADPQDHPLRIDVVRAELADLADAQARAVREHRCETMSLRADRGEKPLDLRAAQHHRHTHAWDARHLLGPLEGDAVQKPEGARVYVDRRRAAAALAREVQQEGANLRCAHSAQ